MIQIHPTVIMSISEHHTRTRAITRSIEKVIGILLGKRTDQSVEIVDSFELKYNKDFNSMDRNTNCNYVIDREFYDRRVLLVKQVFPELDFIGYYTTILPHEGSASTDIQLYKKFSELIPNPILLKLEPHKRENDPKISGSLPIQVFEPVIEVSSGLQVNLIEVSWTIVTEEVEIIGLEHNAKITEVDVAPSVAIDNLRLQYSAVKQLKDRIKVISKFLKDVISGNLPYDSETVEEIIKLSKRFPLMNSEEYTKVYNTHCNDVALNTYLGILTKGSMGRMHFGMPHSKTRALSSTHARR